MSKPIPQYELQAKGRVPRFYFVAAEAGAAFFAAKRDEMPKVLMHEGEASVHVAMTTRDPREPGGYGHLLLAPPDDFKAGYDQAKRALPARAVGLHDINPPQPPKGITVSEQQQPQPAGQQNASETAATRRLQVRGVDVEKLTFTKTQDQFGERVTYTAMAKGGEVIAKHGGIERKDLTYHLGETVGRAIRDYQGPEGQFVGRQLDAPAHEQEPRLNFHWKEQVEYAKAADAREEAARQAKHVAPTEASAPPAAPTKPVAPEVINTIELAAPRMPEPEKPTPAAAPTPQKPDREQLLKSLQERFEVASVGTLLKPADEYRIGGDKGQLRVAFTDHGKRLESRYDAPEVVRGMVDLAQAKGWREIQVAGTLEFQRATWMEGNLRGIHVAGYTPSRQDEERLKAAREQPAQQRQLAQQQTAPEKPANTVEPSKAAQPAKQPEQAAAPAAGGSKTTREQFLNMARSVMKDQGYPKDEIDKTVAVMAKRVDGMLARGEALPKIQVYDKAAPSRAPVPTVVQQPTPQQSPNRGPAPEVAAHAP